MEARSFSENVAFGASLDGNSSVTQGCRFGAVPLQGNRRPIMLQKPHFLKKVELPWTIARSTKCPKNVIFEKVSGSFRLENNWGQLI